MAESVFTDDTIAKIGAILNDQSRGMAERFRALFTLRNINCDSSIREISLCFSDPSALLKHECVYCLGQMQNTSAIPVLINLLEDLNQQPIVRHEAGEALGTIARSPAVYNSVTPVLQKYTSDASTLVSDTCHIALEFIEWKQATATNNHFEISPFNSFDPAPPMSEGDVESWGNDLLDSSLSLFKRYRAMFSLRNANNVEAVNQLIKGFGDTNPLFKHEVAFVLGQLENPLATAALQSTLEDASEDSVVRHECADALGAIAEDKSLEILHKFVTDAEPIVRESCIVALDMHQYKKSDEFQYADGVSRVA